MAKKEKQRRCCGICGESGHNARTCKKRKAAPKDTAEKPKKRPGRKPKKVDDESPQPVAKKVPEKPVAEKKTVDPKRAARVTALVKTTNDDSVIADWEP